MFAHCRKFPARQFKLTIIMGCISSKELLPPIRLIAFQLFKEIGDFPRYPENKNIYEGLNTIDRSINLIVFISHCWLRGWSGAEGWDGKPHPDNANGDKYRLCVEGIER